MTNFMELALDLAKKAAREDEVPVGALVVMNGTVIASAHNEVYTKMDPTAHAEILAIRRASLYLSNTYLTDCDIYVTLEPCPMCAYALSIARIRRLYFAASDPKGGGIENGPRLYSNGFCQHIPEVYGGLKEEESSSLLKEFFITKRKIAKHNHPS